MAHCSTLKTLSAFVGHPFQVTHQRAIMIEYKFGTMHGLSILSYFGDDRWITQMYAINKGTAMYTAQLPTLQSIARAAKDTANCSIPITQQDDFDGRLEAMSLVRKGMILKGRPT